MASGRRHADEGVAALVAAVAAMVADAVATRRSWPCPRPGHVLDLESIEPEPRAESFRVAIWPRQPMRGDNDEDTSSQEGPWASA